MIWPIRCGALPVVPLPILPALCNKVYYVYVLKSKRDGKFYVGYTENIMKRMELHNAGKIESTKWRRPFELIYYEASLSKEDAVCREKYLKTSYGKRYILNRLKRYLETKW